MNNEKIVFIDRTKKKSIIERINESLNNLKSRIIANQYKNEKLIWKLLYDKIYRRDMYRIIINSKDEKDTSFLRSLYYRKQHNETFPLLKQNIELDNDDLDIFLENNYLLNSNKLYALETYSYFLYIPLLAVSIYYKYKNNTKWFNFTSFLFVSVLACNFLALYKRKKFYESRKDKRFEGDNEQAMAVYRKLFYIDI
jgi:hypothetical protein